MVEPGEGWGSIEPFLYLDDELVTWNDIEPVQELEDGYLPMPSVTWTRSGARLQGHARLPPASPDRSSLWLRYRVSNASAAAAAGPAVPGAATVPGQSALAERWATAAAARSGCRSWPLPSGAVVIDRDKRVVPLSRPEGFGAARFEDGSITEYFCAGALPEQAERVRQVRLRLGRARVQPRSRRRAGAGRLPGRAAVQGQPAAAGRGQRRGCGERCGPRRSTRPSRTGTADARPGRDRAAGRGSKDRRDAQDDARLHPDQRRRPGAPAGAARLQADLDPRRRADLGGAAAHGPPRGGAPVHRMVRALSVRRRLRFPAASTRAAPTARSSTTATGNGSICSPSTTASRATSAC